MTIESFNKFLDEFLNSWRNSSITDLSPLISKDYQAREISNGKIEDFGYEESIQGWEQGFNFVIEHQAKWELSEIQVSPLREKEVLAILSATIILQDKRLTTSNLFFNTFKENDNGEWKLIRSYIEAGVPNENIDNMSFINRIAQN